MTIRHYKVKEWNRFDIDMQQELCNRFKITLTDYKAPLTKRELALKIGMAVLTNLNKKNLDKGIGLIQKGTSMISEFSKAFDNPKKEHSKNQNVRSAFWGNESKENTMSFYGKKIPFSSSKKIGF